MESCTQKKKKKLSERGGVWLSVCVSMLAY